MAARELDGFFKAIKSYGKERNMRLKDNIDYEVEAIMDLYHEWQDNGGDFNEPDVMAKFIDQLFRQDIIKS